MLFKITKENALVELSDNSNPNHDGGEPTEFRWPTDPDSRQRRVEAVLMMARKPLNTRKVSQLAELEDGTQAGTIIKQLNQQYDQRQRAFHIKRVAGGYQMRTRPQFADWIRRLDHIPPATRLSTPALETLTVVAYRQPIIKADIEAIRGVSCGEMLRQLLEKGLVKIAGRSEELGRPYLYATTKEFLTQYGLGSLNDLPRSKQLLGKGLPDWVSSGDNHAPKIVNQKSSSESLSSTTTENTTDPLDGTSQQEEEE